MDDSIFDAAIAATPVMAASTAEERVRWLNAVADALDRRSGELVGVADRETHLGEARLSGEVSRTTGQLRLFAAVVLEGSYLEAIIDHAVPGSVPPRPDLRRILRPTGPVAVYAASNFPFAFSVAGGDTASALAVGCPVVVKAHPGHPELSRLTASIVSEALGDAGAPAGAFALVEGYESGVALVRHPAITAAAFTGSVVGGRALYDLAAARPAPIPFYGELGSVNPVVVTRSADEARGDDLAAGLSASFTLGSGQFCTKPGVVFLPSDSRLERGLAELELPGPRPMLTDSIDRGFRAGLERLLAVPGVELVAGSSTGGAAVVAASLSTFEANTEVLLAEVFGPLTLLVRYDSHDRLVASLGELEGSLTATLHAQPGEQVAGIVARLERIAGRVL
ncbi:MAG: aldehyde dehydrogenase family protein, partial [Lacisediminihabitans sp.]